MTRIFSSLRTNPGFFQGGFSAGGAPEFVIPNGPIPPGATTTVIGLAP
ncbi:MAG: polymorphic toxin type 10 domain-containing protein [Acidiferrobacteraceae bacterium]